MALNKILLFVTVVALINILLFFGLPSPITFTLSELDPIGLFIFPFSHFDILHLIENLLGLMFTAALAIELEMRAETFIMAFFVGVFIAVPLLAFFPMATIAGSSTGIFGALAGTLLKAKKFVSVSISYPLATLFIFSTSLTSMFSGAMTMAMLKSDVFHFFGFLAGAAVSFSKRTTRIFSGVMR